MNDFLKYFEDESFVQWVLNPNEELNKYWGTYLQNNPSAKKQITSTRILLHNLKSKREKISMEEVTSLYLHIANNKNSAKKLPFTKRLFFPFIKYVAIAIIFFSAGVIMFYQYNKKQQLVTYFPIENVHFEDEARLILSSGDKILLHERESIIEYDQEGKIVINNIDTIAKQEEAQSSGMNQLIIPYGRSSSIKLPDGTLVYLNAGSTLMYPTAFSGKVREVFLLGEAYFEVAQNSKIPFMVKTNDLTVTAVGTIFNVSAYPTDKIIETVLVEGKVVVSENTFKIKKKEVVLEPDNLAVFHRESLETEIIPVDVDNYTAWRHGYLIFNREELNRVISRVERYYNLKIFLDNPNIAGNRITGKLVLKEDKEKVLEVLATISKTQLLNLNATTYGLK